MNSSREKVKKRIDKNIIDKKNNIKKSNLIIIIVTIILFLVLIGWTWSNLASIDKNKKIVFMLISIVVMMIVTLIIFSISKIGVNYENENMVGPVRVLLVAVFTSLNGFVVIQYIAKIFGKTYEQIIDEEEAKKKIAIILSNSRSFIQARQSHRTNSCIRGTRLLSAPCILRGNPFSTRDCRALPV